MKDKGKLKQIEMLQERLYDELLLKDNFFYLFIY